MSTIESISKSMGVKCEDLKYIFRNRVNKFMEVDGKKLAIKAEDINRDFTEVETAIIKNYIRKLQDIGNGKLVYAMSYVSNDYHIFEQITKYSDHVGYYAFTVSKEYKLYLPVYSLNNNFLIRPHDSDLINFVISLFSKSYNSKKEAFDKFLGEVNNFVKGIRKKLISESTILEHAYLIAKGWALREQYVLRDGAYYSSFFETPDADVFYEVTSHLIVESNKLQDYLFFKEV